jgi:hypothetical protein
MEKIEKMLESLIKEGRICLCSYKQWNFPETKFCVKVPTIEEDFYIFETGGQWSLVKVKRISSQLNQQQTEFIEKTKLYHPGIQFAFHSGVERTILRLTCLLDIDKIKDVEDFIQHFYAVEDASKTVTNTMRYFKQCRKKSIEPCASPLRFVFFECRNRLSGCKPSRLRKDHEARDKLVKQYGLKDWRMSHGNFAYISEPLVKRVVDHIAKENPLMKNEEIPENMFFDTAAWLNCEDNKLFWNKQ